MPFQPRVAILVPAPDYYEQWQPAFARKAAALTAAGLLVEQRVWTDPGDLSGYDLILPLFAWGYQREVAAWYALLDRMEGEGLPVVNPVPVLRWNSDKAYLAELGAKGVAVVPTVEVAALDDAGLAEARVALGDDEIAGERQRLAARERGAVHRGDRGFRRLEQQAQRLGEDPDRALERLVLQQCARRAGTAGVLLVAAGAEDLARPGEHDHPHRRVVARRAQRRAQRVEQRVVERVAARRAVEHQRAHRAVVAHEQARAVVGNGRAHRGPRGTAPRAASAFTRSPSRRSPSRSAPSARSRRARRPRTRPGRR